jgi:hypothetical protein
MLHWFYTYVASVYLQRFICFSDVCCWKYVYLDVVYVSLICCKCFIWMLHMFAIVFKVFLQVFQTHVSSILSVFGCMLHVLYLDVSKVDRLLHIGCTWEVGGARAVPAPGPVCGHAKRRRGQGHSGTGAECRCARETNRPGPRYHQTDQYPCDIRAPAVPNFLPYLIYLVL